MSGPKAVRVISKKERIARINGLLARLHKALALWQQVLNQCQQSDDVFWADIQQRLATFETQLAQDRFNELDNDIPRLTKAILNHREAKLAQYAKDQAAQKAMLRGQQEHAQFLLETLKQQNIAIADNMSETLLSIAEGKNQGTASSVLQQAFALLHVVPKTGLSDAQQAQQQSLLRLNTVRDQALSLNEWVLTQQAKRHPRLALVDELLARLCLQAPIIAQSFADRLLSLEAQVSDTQFNLRLDSFLIDLKSASDKVNQEQTLLNEIVLLQAQWQVQQQSLGMDMALPDLDMSTFSLEQLQTALQQWQNQVAANETAIAAISSREAVLSGLASLGYEVKEGMQTLWANDGRVHLRNPATPGYGVEIGGQTSSKVQVRTVRFSPEENKQRDTDVETLWCQDFAKLQQYLSESGDQLTIEKAFEVGQVAVKTVPEALMDAPQMSQQKPIQHKRSF